MRWHGIKVRGLGPFAELVDVDLAELDGLVALTGANGSGKSTMLELLLGAIYRRCPTRGSLSDLATTRDAFVEVLIDDVAGERFTVRQTVDAVSGKGETLITDASGRPVVESAKLRAADAWLAVHVPPVEVLLASEFCAQGSGGFLDLDPAQAKAVLLRVLGIERIEAACELAREVERRVAAEHEAHAMALAGHRAKVQPVFAAEGVLEQARSAEALARGTLEDRRGHLRSCEQQNAARRAQAERYEAWKRARAEVTATVDRERARYDELVRQLEGAKPAGDVERAEAASVRLEAARAELAPIEQSLTEAKVAQAGARAKAVAIEREAAVAKKDLERLEKDAGALATKAAQFERVVALTRALPKLREDLVVRQAELTTVEEELAKLGEQRLAGADERIEGLREGLDEIASEDRESTAATLAHAKLVAIATLDADDALVVVAKTYPETKRQAEAALAAAKRYAADAAEDVRHAEAAAERADDVAKAVDELAAHKTLIGEGRTALAELGLEAAHEAIAAAGRHVDALKAQTWQLTTEIDELAREAKLLVDLRAATERTVALEAAVSAQRERVVEAGKRVEELADVEAPGPEADEQLAEKHVGEVETEARVAAGALTRAELALEQARAGVDEGERLEVVAAKAASVLSESKLIAEALGRNGVQAYEIDAVGPELSQLATSLLHEAFGSRWTVSFETTRVGATGEQLEAFRVCVLDTERGTDGPAKRLSGGERVIVGEAISLALTVLACQRAGVDAPTLVRDESGAALDASNGRNYIAMLRRASALVGAKRCLLVSHSAELAALCDARLLVEDGAVCRVP